jgi:DNA transformation protein
VVNPHDSEVVDYLLDLLQVLGPVHARRMFGAHGLFIDGLMFALVSHNEWYLKVDSQTLSDYTDQGLEPFTYQRCGKACALNYYQSPPALFEDQQQMRRWGNRAIEVALRAAANIRHHR